MKSLEFIYQETEIHFLLDKEGDVMINATEMAKVFNRRTKDYLKSQATKDLINELKRALNGAQIIDDRGRNGIYFDRRLALDFAAWLDVRFRVWILTTLEDLLFGHYKQHWYAHAEQEAARIRMESIKKEILTNPSAETVQAYFQSERDFKSAKAMKTAAIRSQLKLFNTSESN